MTEPQPDAAADPCEDPCVEEMPPAFAGPWRRVQQAFAPSGEAGTEPDGAQQDNLRLLARLRGGSTGGFTRAAARRLDLDSETLWRALHGGSAIPLALLACALGFDRAVFGRILGAWQGVHGSPPSPPESARPLILSIFRLTPPQALERLRAGLPG